MNYKQIMSEADIERFWNKVDKSGECWLWTGGKSLGGYGRFKFQRKMHGSPRISLSLKIGEINDKKFACHHCDNPACVNPDHLFEGTNSDNMLDCSKKGRLHKRTEAHTWGEESNFSKLTTEQVIDIKKRIANGEKGKDIAQYYNVTPSAISDIKRGRNWVRVEIS